MASEALTKEPITGPLPGTDSWHEVRSKGIFASEGAAACGVSDHRQPLDVYLEKLGLVESFGGNDYTDRGKRFEPFIAGEYAQRFGCELRTNLPVCMSAATPHIGATPDAVRVDNPGHGVEFKACNWRRASQLGAEGTDEVFPDWLIQTQQQMYVMGWSRCDVFVMLDLHDYRRFEVERDERLIGLIVERETDLWERILRRDPPPLNAQHPRALELMRSLYGVDRGRVVDVDYTTAAAWAEVQQCNQRIKALEELRDAKKAEVLATLGTAAVGKLPGGERELARSIQADAFWTSAEIEKLCPGTTKRRGFVRLTERNLTK